MPIQKGPANLGTGTIDAAELASSSVTTAKIADAAITTDKIAAGAVATVDIAANAVTPAKMANSGLEFGVRNKIINGAMVIDQRNAGASVTNIAGSVYTLDRWQAAADAATKFTIQQNAGSVTPPAGFSNYLGCTSSSAYSVPSGENYIVRTKIEGVNIADLAWGTASAKTITLSFWVRSSLTGTFGGALANNASGRTYPFTYTISSANTWEYETITIAGDTSGTWLTTNGIGLEIRFSLGSGSTQSGTAGAWASSNYYSATGAVSVVGTNAATFYITGVQLEAGSTATPFEYRQYTTEMQLCQRYYCELGRQIVGRAESGTITTMVAGFPVRMRSSPSVITVITSAVAIAVPGLTSSAVSSVLTNNSTDNATSLGIQTSGSAMSTGAVTVGNIDRIFGFSSEL